MYFFPCVWTDCRNFLPFPLRYRQNMSSECMNCLFRYLQNSFGANQEYTLEDSPNRCFECSVMQWSQLSPVFDFSYFAKDHWRTNSFLILKIYCFALFLLYDGDMFRLSKEKQSQIAWKCFVRAQFFTIFKHPYSQLLYIFGLMRINLNCHDIIAMVRSTASDFIYYH